MAARQHGWTTIGIDINESLQPDVVADIRCLPVQCEAGHITVLWASPPCDEYSKLAQPGIFPEWKTRIPDLSIWTAAYRAINVLKPRYWCIENVLGAQQIWGKASTHFGSIYLWTNMDINGHNISVGKTRLSSRNKSIRAMTPYIVGDTICRYVEAR